eukprot:269177_1
MEEQFMEFEEEELTGMGNPVMGDSTRCPTCHQYQDYACEDIYICYNCIGHRVDKEVKEHDDSIKRAIEWDNRDMEHDVDNELMNHTHTNANTERECNKMDTSPYVNGETLLSCKGKEVFIIGNFINDKNSNNFRACDGKCITVQTNGSHPFKKYNTKYINILGVVQNDCSITVRRVRTLDELTQFGDALNFNLDLWNKFVILSQQYPHLF